MSEELTLEDELFMIEDALEECYNLADFLYLCLTEEGYEHQYPEMSLRTLNEIKPFVRKRLWCGHSSFVPKCDACQENAAIFTRRAEIIKKQQ